MTIIHRTECAPYPPEILFALVQDIERYPEFLPWCKKGVVLEKTEDMLLATLTLSVAGFERSFTTRNHNEPPSHIQVSLEEGAFLKHLEGSWTFEAIEAHQTKISLTMEFEFANQILSMIARPIFEEIAHTLVHTFCTRATTLYGQSN